MNNSLNKTKKNAQLPAAAPGIGIGDPAKISQIMKGKRIM
jgi:hypothetical protein